MRTLEVYTDGSCNNKNGFGGWGFVMFPTGKEEQVIRRNQGFSETTNNRMEMLGVIEALKLVPDAVMMVNIHSDSRYVIDGITKWIHKWVRDNALDDMKNADLWKQMYELVHERSLLHVRFIWVKGHAGNKWNEEADKLAGEAYRKTLTEHNAS